MTIDHFSTIAQLAHALRSGKLDITQLVRFYLDRISQLNPQLNAFVAIYRDKALQDADTLGRELRAGQDCGPLHGIPIAVKDNIDVAGEITSGCSRALRDNIAIADAQCIAQLRSAGAIIIGKTNMHELAYGGTGQVSAHGPARNPWDTRRNAGGSSSGSGVAVASGMVPAALGTDTGGSIRIPAAACGIIGFKPSLGAVCTQGVLPLSWTLDHVGPITRSVQDANILFAQLVPQAELYDAEHYRTATSAFPSPTKTIGIANFPGYALAPFIQACLDRSITALKANGYRIETFDLQHTHEAHRCWLGIMYAEASCHYETRLLERYNDFSEPIRTQLEAGRYIDAMTYLKAQRFRSFFSEYYAELLGRFDLIAAPTLPTVAPRIGQDTVELPSGSVPTQDAMTFSNLTANMLGWPAVSIPMGLTRDQLPAGISFMSGPGRDKPLLEAAHQLAQMIGKTPCWV